jgi:hypothetical protein
MNKFPFKSINTGQKFPAGIDLHEGQCKQCGRKGNIATIKLEVAAIALGGQLDCCAECLADFILVPMGKVFGQQNGEWKELRGYLR